jgi:hypothetical protein
LGVKVVAAGLTILGVIGSVVGVLAFFDARRNRRIKLLMYEQTAPFPLATTRGDDNDYELSIHYKRGDGGEEVIDAAFVTYLVFANFGKEPVRAQDIAASNPLRIEVEDTRVLDISLAGSHRDVNGIHLSSANLGDQTSSAEIKFDFLDYRDGGLIRVLSTGRAKKLSLRGDIIGMPDGMARSDQPRAQGPWGKMLFGFWLFTQALALAAVAYVYKQVENSWDHVWVLVLPFAALVLPGVCVVGAVMLSDAIWPTRTHSASYPQELSPPGWIRRAMRIPPEEDVLYPEFPVEEDEIVDGHPVNARMPVDPPS